MDVCLVGHDWGVGKNPNARSWDVVAKTNSTRRNKKLWVVFGVFSRKMSRSFFFGLLLVSSWPLTPWGQVLYCSRDADCQNGYLCNKGKCLTACGGIGGRQFGCQTGYDCIDLEDGCDPRVGRNCPGTCTIQLGAPGDTCGVPGMECPALVLCPCSKCDNGVDSYGCCGKCVVVVDPVTGVKSCRGRVPKESCPNTHPCDNASGFISERVCDALYQYDCHFDCNQDFCQTLYGLIRKPRSVASMAWIPVACRR
jgi:hypothetical protein